MKKIFIDGKFGTTGLRIHDRITDRYNYLQLQIPESLKKDNNVKKGIIHDADILIMCLPDDAAKETLSLITNPDMRVIDTSTAHRTDSDWVYGFPELGPEFREKIKNAKRVAVPGCHASGFVALVYPLIKHGLISKDIKLCCHSITGYSGGGNRMINEYEQKQKTKDIYFAGPRQYALSQNHKHLKEMQFVAGLTYAPVFSPIVCNFYSGMEVTVPIFASDLLNGASLYDVKNLYKSLYKGPIVTFNDDADENGFLSATAYTNKDTMEISIHGNEDRIILVARFDNLGKGASGAAIQCLNIMTGLDETAGLEC